MQNDTALVERVGAKMGEVVASIRRVSGQTPSIKAQLSLRKPTSSRAQAGLSS